MRIFTLSILLLLLLIQNIHSQTQLTIAEAREANMDGTLVREGETVILEGKAIGPNFNPNLGTQFIIVDISGPIGITVFSNTDNFGYEVTDFDNLRITGELTSFNGLAEIVPTSIDVLPPGGFNPTIRIVDNLGEDTESILVTYNDATLVDPGQWRTSGSFNVDVTNGSTLIQVRIDADTDISGMEAPTGTFDLVGIGGQFDSSAPHDSGYQLFPRSIADIDPYVPATGGTPYTEVTIPQLRENDADGIALLSGEAVQVTSVVYGVNLRPDGLQFTLIDENNVGVGVFNLEGNFGYEVLEGDMVTVQGILSEFNGLTQINPDTVWLQSVGNDLVDPETVLLPSEETESSLISILVTGATDEAQWIGSGSFNVEYLNGNNDPFTVRIDNDVFWSTQPSPGTTGIIWTGIGGQFDGSAPHDSGYQLLPRVQEDLGFWLSSEDLIQSAIEVYPNPANDLINVDAEKPFNSLKLINSQGQLVKTTNQNQLDVRDLASGMYQLQVNFDEGLIVKKIIIE